MERFIIDRFEADMAVLEATDADGMHTVLRAALPPDTKEGDTLCLSDGVYMIDAADTAARHTRIREKMDRLFE